MEQAKTEWNGVTMLAWLVLTDAGRKRVWAASRSAALEKVRKRGLLVHWIVPAEPLVK